MTYVYVFYEFNLHVWHNNKNLTIVLYHDRYFGSIFFDEWKIWVNNTEKNTEEIYMQR